MYTYAEVKQFLFKETERYSANLAIHATCYEKHYLAYF